MNKPRGSYTIPHDFSLSAFQFLPFDLGDEEEIQATFAFPAQSVAGEIEVLTHGRGTLEIQPDKSLRWNIAVKNSDAAVAMALKNASLGMRPCSPASLVSLWNSTITKAVEAHGRI